MMTVEYGEWQNYSRAYDIRINGGKHYLFVGNVDRLTVARKAEMARRILTDNGSTFDGPPAALAALWDRSPSIRRDALSVRTMHVPDGPYAREALDYRDDHGMGEFPADLVIVTV